MKFSILIAHYNNGHFFSDCYKSIIDQTYKNWEVIIVDDCSTDNSVTEITKVIEDDSRFRLEYNRENRGCGFTKNKCASLASGSILGFLDPDDTLYSNALEIMVSFHQSFKDVAVISSKHEIVDLNLNFIKPGSHGEALPEGKSYLTYGKGALTQFATFKKKYYNMTEGINPNFKRAVDQDLYYKLEETGKHLFIGEVLYKYRIHEGSISNNDNLYKARYWHLIAMIDAYRRRKKLKKTVDNFKRHEINIQISNHYLYRFECIKGTSKFTNKIYFLSKALLQSPFHRFEFKIKSLILVLIGKI